MCDIPGIHYNDVTMSPMASHQPRDCLLNCLFRCRSNKTSKLRVTGLCAENSPGTGEFAAQKATNAENVSICWRHHVICTEAVGGIWVKYGLTVCINSDLELIIYYEIFTAATSSASERICAVYVMSPDYHKSPGSWVKAIDKQKVSILGYSICLH